MPRARLRAVIALLGVLALTAGCSLLNRTPDPAPVAEDFARDLAERSVNPQMLTNPAAADEADILLDDAVENLGAPPTFHLREPPALIEPLADEEPTTRRATAVLDVEWPLRSGAWRYGVDVPLEYSDDAQAWKIAWTPSVLHPRLRDNQSLQLRTVVPQRGPILSSDGDPLFTSRPVVSVLVQPRRVKNLDEVLSVLDEALQIEPEPLRSRVESADRDALVDVITLRMEDYTPLRSMLRPVPGLVFQRSDRLLTAKRSFARALLGQVGPATADVLEEIGRGFGPGAELGLSGLQRQFQQQLAGRPGFAVVSAAADGDAVDVLHRVPAQRGAALRTTLRPQIQRAADAALADVDNPSALVAIQPSTGEVLAVANGPSDGSINRAFMGQYPPGSTFKVVSTAALLADGLEADQPVDCPATATIGGRRFRNAEGSAIGRAPFDAAFAQSCNTTMVRLAPELPPGAVAGAAEAVGFGRQWSPGPEAYRGQVPPPDDIVERAAESIGQGRVLASPLLMATVAAAVADGTWRPPVLLPDHAQDGGGPIQMDRAAARALDRMMRQVVTEGTGEALRDVSGGPVHAKTGTAEYGQDSPPRTHAWIIAYQGDLALAVLIEDGGAGGAVAAPVAADFFDRL